MINLYCFGLILTVSFAFQIYTVNKTTDAVNFKSSVGCSQTRVKIVNTSISECEFLGLRLSTQCIKNYLLNRTNGEKWDVLAENPDKSDAKISYWSYDDCAIRYERFGQLKDTYTIWKATSSNQRFVRKLSQNIFIQEGSNNQSIKNDNTCPQGSTKIAKDSIAYCQNSDTLMQASCIRNNIKSKLGQKWDAIISSEDKSQFSVRYTYFDGCVVSLKSFGTRKRNYLLWKAE